MGPGDPGSRGSDRVVHAERPAPGAARLKVLLDLLVHRRGNDEWIAAEQVAEQLVGWIVAAEPNGDDATD